MNFYPFRRGENPQLYSISRQYYAVSAEHSGEIRTAFVRPRSGACASKFCRRAVGIDCCRFRAVCRHGFGFAGLRSYRNSNPPIFWAIWLRFRCCANLGPVLAAILVCQQRGRCDDQRNRFDENDRTAEAMNVMAVNPVARVVALCFGQACFPCRFGFDFQRGWHLRRVFGRRNLAGLDSGIFWSQMQNNITIHYDVINGLIKSAAFGVAVTLLPCIRASTASRPRKAFCVPARVRWFRPP